MTYKITKVIFTGFMLASTQLYAESYNFMPGSWEITSTTKLVEIEAPPEIEKMMRRMSQMSKSTETECVRDINSIFEPEPDDAESCKTKVRRISANKLIFNMQCTGEDGISKGTGEMDLNGKNFASILEMETTEDSMKLKVEIIGKGKYIGTCN